MKLNPYHKATHIFSCLSEEIVFTMEPEVIPIANIVSFDDGNVDGNVDYNQRNIS